MAYSFPPNYGGKQPNNTSYVKSFSIGANSQLWKPFNYNNKITLTPASNNTSNVLIPGDLYVNGSFVNPSDLNIKENIQIVPPNMCDNLDYLNVVEFNFKDDKCKKIHYGFIAQEVSKQLPELVTTIPKIKNDDNDCEIHNILAINYLEIVPLLVAKIQKMQKEIDILKSQIKE
jgi:hypothetical protein